MYFTHRFTYTSQLFIFTSVTCSHGLILQPVCLYIAGPVLTCSAAPLFLCLVNTRMSILEVQMQIRYFLALSMHLYIYRYIYIYIYIYVLCACICIRMYVLGI